MKEVLIRRLFLVLTAIFFMGVGCSDAPNEPIPLDDLDDLDDEDNIESCAEDFTLCGTECVDLDSDSRHCNACDAECPGGGACENGVCRTVQDCRTEGCSGLNYCNQNDGQCYPGCEAASQCPTVSQGDARCINNTCAIECNVGTRECNGTCSSCPTGPGVAATGCSGGECVASSCNAGYELCGGVCAACPTGDGSSSFGCSGQQCVIDDCEDGYRQCDGSCAACPDADPNGSFACDGSSCVVACDPGYHDCGGECVPSDSVDTCGDRCEACPSSPNGSAICTDALECSVQCSDGYENCGGQCSECPDGDGVATTGCAGTQCVATGCGPAYWICGGACCQYPNNGRIFVHDGEQAKDIVVDQERRIHIVFSSPSLRVMSWDGAQWNTDILEDSSPTDWASIDIDSTGKLFVAYRRDATTSLIFAERTGNGWAQTTIDQVGNVGKYASLKVDGDGNPHISYYDESNQNLKYTHRSGGTWSVETAHSTDDHVGRETSMVVGADGTPHILYHDEENRQVLHTWKSGGSWSRQVVADGGENGIDAVMDSQGNIHVAFISQSGNQRYAHWDGTVWSTTTVSTLNSFLFTSIAVDSNDLPEIVFANTLIDDPLRHARFDGSIWNVNSIGNGERRVALDIDSEGVRHVVYGHGTWFYSERGTYYYGF